MDKEDLNLRAAAAFLQNSSLHPKASPATPSSILSVDPIKNSPCGEPFLSTPASTPPIQHKQQVEASSPDIGHADTSTVQAKPACADDAPVEEEEWNLRAAVAACCAPRGTTSTKKDVSSFPPDKDSWREQRMIGQETLNGFIQSQNV